MKHISKKSAALGVVTALVFAVAAYAYLTASGSGSGSGSASASNKAMILTGNGAAAITKLGDSTGVTISAANSGDNAQVLPSFTVTVSPVGTDCPAESFQLSNGLQEQTLTSDVQVPANESADIASTSVSFVNVDAPQNGCTGYKLAYSTPAAP